MTFGDVNDGDIFYDENHWRRGELIREDGKWNLDLQIGDV